MHKQPYQGLVLLTPSTPGDYVTDGSTYSQRLYVKPEDVSGWREIPKAEYDEMVRKQQEPEPEERPA